MKCVRGVDGMFSFVFVLTQALYETGNEWVGTRVSYTKRDKMALKMQTYNEMSTTNGQP